MKKLLIAMFVLVIASPVLAQDAEMGPPPVVEASHNAVVAFLSLTPEQVETWNEIYWSHRGAEAPLKEAIRDVQEDIDALFEAGAPDPGAVGALFIERRALTGELVEVHVVYHEDFVAMLDDIQLRRLRLVARADDVQKFIPAFKLFELIPRR
ncbi:MAG: periplasmic heavy metal sensor [Acidobacteria bacterium]|jgi:hypothetical protein|nr:periplasmic heavy metal sensor [Acidobacteriota bacterium]